MNQADYLADNPYATLGTAAEATADARLSFIRKTYTHLVAAVYALVLLEFIFFKVLPLDEWMPALMQQGRWWWLVMFGGFMLVSWMANRWARSDTSIGTQYMGLFAYVLAQAVILCPLLWIANLYAMKIGGGEYSPILIAGIATLLIFGVLTATVFLTRHDFSYLGPILGIAGMVGFGLIALSLFGLINFRDTSLFGICGICLRIYSLRHLERPASLSYRSARGRFIGPVRLGSAFVLVYLADCDFAVGA